MSDVGIWSGVGREEKEVFVEVGLNVNVLDACGGGLKKPACLLI